MPTGHPAPAPERFWLMVQKTESCWLWTGATSKGYGRFNPDGRVVWAYRYAYELLVGPVPAGMELDHTCRVKVCVNVAHLEPVTHRENMLRAPHIRAFLDAPACINGHPWTEANTLRVGTRRFCRACNREKARRRQARKAVA